MKISARNQLPGKVISITHGVVNTEVGVELAPGMEITSIITRGSAESLNLSVGQNIAVVIKATNVMLGVDDS